MIIHLNSCYFRADNQQPFNFSCAPPREIWVTGLFPEGLDIEGHVFEPTCQVGSSWIFPNGHAKMGEINGNQGLNLGIDMHWWGPNSQNPIWNGKIDYSDDVHGAAIHDRRNGGSVHGHREAGHMARWSCLCHLGLGAICFEAYNYIQQFCWPLSFPNNIDGPWLKCITTPAVVIGHPTYRSRACFKLQRMHKISYRFISEKRSYDQFHQAYVVSSHHPNPAFEDILPRPDESPGHCFNFLPSVVVGENKSHEK